MGVGTKVMVTQNDMTAFKRGSYMYMYSKLLLARTVYTVFKRLLILFVTCGLINFLCLPFFKFLDSTSKFNLSTKQVS